MYNSQQNLIDGGYAVTVLPAEMLAELERIVSAILDSDPSALPDEQGEGE